MKNKFLGCKVNEQDNLNDDFASLCTWCIGLVYKICKFVEIGLTLYLKIYHSCQFREHYKLYFIKNTNFIN